MSQLCSCEPGELLQAGQGEGEREKEKMPPMNKKPQVIIGAGNEALMATAVADSINHKFPTARESKEQVLEV